MATRIAIRTGRNGRPARGRNNDLLRGPIVEGDINAFLERLPYIQSDLETREGAIDLLGVVRPKSSYYWDLLIAASWVKPGLLSGLNTIIDVLKDRTGTSGLMTVSIRPLDDRVPILTALRALPRVVNDLYEMRPGDYGGVDVETGYLFTNRLGKRSRQTVAR